MADIRHQYLVYNTETEEVWQLFAKNNLDAICQCPGGKESDPFTGPFRTKELLTPEGYRIMRLRDVPKGAYFSFVQSGGDKPTANTVWVKGEYDRSERKWWIYRFDDVNCGKFRTGKSLVTIDITF